MKCTFSDWPQLWNIVSRGSYTVTICVSLKQYKWYLLFLSNAQKFITFCLLDYCNIIYVRIKIWNIITFIYYLNIIIFIIRSKTPVILFLICKKKYIFSKSKIIIRIFTNNDLLCVYSMNYVPAGKNNWYGLGKRGSVLMFYMKLRADIRRCALCASWLQWTCLLRYEAERFQKFEELCHIQHDDTNLQFQVNLLCPIYIDSFSLDSHERFPFPL